MSYFQDLDREQKRVINCQSPT